MFAPAPRDEAGSPGRRPLVVAWLVACLVALGGCAAPAVDDGFGDGTPAEIAARRDAALLAFDRFRVRGGLGVWNDETSLSARVDWRQAGETLDVALAAPLGLGTARLVRDERGARLERGDAPPIVGDSADTVLQRALGLDVPVPLDQLALWLRGLPGEGRDVRRDERGRLLSLRWSDASGTPWQARVLDRTVVDGLEVPSLVTANGAGYRLRLVLRDWSPGADPEVAPEAGGAPASGDGSRRLSIPSR